MTDPQTGIQLDRAVDSLIVGKRHRTDLGDIETLAASIDRDGLLQPLTITIDGVLVCGARRLAAIKMLGWRTVNVWVRSGLSDRLGQLLAEQDDNMLHKPYTHLEAAGLYREIKQLMAEDAARRKAATQFSAENQPGDDGPGKFPGPSGALGDARELAAAMIPGGGSYKTLEKVGYIEEIAANPAQPETIRTEAAAALERIEAGDPVHPLYLAIHESAEAAREVREATMHALAEDAVARANAMKNPHALLRKPLSLDDYLAARPISEPIHLFDCVMPCAGAEGYLLMSEERARSLELPFVRIRSTIERHNAFPEDPIQFRGGWAMDRDALYEHAGVGPQDVDFLEAYDDYPVINMMQIEDLGFCAKGEASAFVRQHEFTIAGSFPFNTSGGQLSVGQAGAAGGYLGFVQALRQLTGTAGRMQVTDARIGLVSGFGMINYDRGLCSGAALLERGTA